MKRFTPFVALLVLSTSQLWAVDLIKGSIEKQGDELFIKTATRMLKIVTTPKIMSSLASLEAPGFVAQSNGQKYSFEFKGEEQGEEFNLIEVPTGIAGAHAFTGVLELRDGSYRINGVAARFGYSKLANGYQFDDISKSSFVAKEVLAEGYFDQDGVFVMQALTPTGLFEATPAHPAPALVQEKIAQAGMKKFLLEEVVKDDISQSKEAFRVRVSGEEQVVPGDGALIVTLSGRQGDTFGSVNGHMVAGIGEVRDDLTLRGEVSNAYVTNEKDILSGNTSLTNYFSHTVQGQNVYRPTYTLIAYGLDKTKLKVFRDALEESHIKFRTKKLEITPQFNCTTETVKSLASAGFEGLYRQWDNTLKKFLTIPLSLGAFGETANTLHYSFANDASRFQPRPAYESFARSFLSERFLKKHGIKRVDFVFYPQIASQRPVGGMALGKVLKALKFLKLYEKYEVNPKTKLSSEALRPILERELRKIPYL